MVLEINNMDDGLQPLANLIPFTDGNMKVKIEPYNNQGSTLYSFFFPSHKINRSADLTVVADKDFLMKLDEQVRLSYAGNNLKSDGISGGWCILTYNSENSSLFSRENVGKNIINVPNKFDFYSSHIGDIAEMLKIAPFKVMGDMPGSVT